MPPDNKTPAKSTKDTADEILGIAEDAVTAYVVKFFAQAGQTLTKEQATTVLSKIGLRILLRNGTLSIPKP